MIKKIKNFMFLLFCSVSVFQGLDALYEFDSVMKHGEILIQAHKEPEQWMDFGAPPYFTIWKLYSKNKQAIIDIVHKLGQLEEYVIEESMLTNDKEENYFSIRLTEKEFILWMIEEHLNK